MNEIQKDFVPYEEAVALKELGFDEPCFCIYNREKVLRFNNLNNPNNRNKGIKLTSNNGRYPAPLYQQAFRWLYQKLDIEKGITPEHLDKLQLNDIHRTVFNSIAFRWFREKHNLYHFVTREVGINTSDIFFIASYYKGKKGNSPKNTAISSNTYEEAGLECLKQLIKIIKENDN